MPATETQTEATQQEEASTTTWRREATEWRGKAELRKHEPSPRDREGTAEGPGKVCDLSQSQHENHSIEGTDPDINDLERQGTA